MSCSSVPSAQKFPSAPCSPPSAPVGAPSPRCTSLPAPPRSPPPESSTLPQATLLSSGFQRPHHTPWVIPPPSSPIPKGSSADLCDLSPSPWPHPSQVFSPVRRQPHCVPYGTPGSSHTPQSPAFPSVEASSYFCILNSLSHTPFRLLVLAAAFHLYSLHPLRALLVLPRSPTPKSSSQILHSLFTPFLHTPHAPSLLQHPRSPPPPQLQGPSLSPVPFSPRPPSCRDPLPPPLPQYSLPTRHPIHAPIAD